MGGETSPRLALFAADRAGLGPLAYRHFISSARFPLAVNQVNQSVVRNVYKGAPILLSNLGIH